MILCVTITASLGILTTNAQVSPNAAAVQTLIDQKNTDIKSLEKEIAAYQVQINALDGQANSLSSAIKSLQITQKKLAADIKVTENKIVEKTLVIKQLTSFISDNEQNIQDDKKIISHSYSLMQQNSDYTLINAILGSKSLSDTVNIITDLSSLQETLFDKVTEIAKSKAKLENTKSLTLKAKSELEKLNKQIMSQRSLVISTASQQSKLLSDTKQSQSQYQDILSQKKKLKDAFEQEILGYESQLKTIINKANLPRSGSGTLAWPVDNVYITQYFGNTSFSTANPQIYNGKGHTGVDFRATIGTPLRAAREGTVIGMANTDLVPGCYSYGRWVMLRHDNGLSTLYAHLSLSTVTIGQNVGTGDIIGYSGNTGYTTGPHLHFGVYASEGVQISSLSSSKSCRNATIPMAPFTAYLNPLSYLPPYR